MRRLLLEILFILLFSFLIALMNHVHGTHRATATIIASILSKNYELAQSLLWSMSEKVIQKTLVEQKGNNNDKSIWKQKIDAFIHRRAVTPVVMELYPTIITREQNNGPDTIRRTKKRTGKGKGDSKSKGNGENLKSKGSNSTNLTKGKGKCDSKGKEKGNSQKRKGNKSSNCIDSPTYSPSKDNNVRTPSSVPTEIPLSEASSTPSYKPNVMTSNAPKSKGSKSINPKGKGKGDSKSKGNGENPKSKGSNSTNLTKGKGKCDSKGKEKGNSQKRKGNKSSNCIDSPTHSPSKDNNAGTPSSVPTEIPSSETVTLPNNSPVMNPESTFMPSSTPSSTPRVMMSNVPSANLSVQPSSRPIVVSSMMPSSTPSSPPSAIISNVPSATTSREPSVTPSSPPRVMISNVPSANPSGDPSSDPIAAYSLMPSSTPSTTPSTIPSSPPSVMRSNAPSTNFLKEPSVLPSPTPSAMISNVPSATTSREPSVTPSSPPKVVISNVPSANPSDTFTISNTPSVMIGNVPSANPSVELSSDPTVVFTILPSLTPSVAPSEIPSITEPPSKGKGKTNGKGQSKGARPSSTPIVMISNAPSRKPWMESRYEPSTAPSFIPSVTSSSNASNEAPSKGKGKTNGKGQSKVSKSKGNNSNGGTSSSPSPSMVNVSPTPSVVSNEPSPLLTIVRLPQCESDEFRFVLNVIPDDFAEEIAWILRSSTGDIVFHGDSVGITTCIKCDTYKFTLFDVTSNGIDKGIGFYEIYVNDELIKEGVDFGFQETITVSQELCNGSYPQLEPALAPSSRNPTHEPSEIELNTTMLPLSDIELDLTFPLSRRFLTEASYGYQNRSHNEDLVSYKEEILFTIVHKVIFESFLIEFSPYFSGIILSLDKIGEDQVSDFIMKLKLKLNGNVSINTKDATFIESLRHVDEIAIEALGGNKFFQSLKKSNDLTLADVISIQASTLRPTGNNIFPDGDFKKDTNRRGSLEIILTVTIACCVLLTTSILVRNHCKRKKPRSALHIDSHLYVDDCSTFSPGSEVRYNHDNLSPDSTDNASTAVINLQEYTGVPDFPTLNLKTRCGSFFESIWSQRSDESCSFHKKRGEDISCVQSVSSDRTPKSANLSPQVRYEV